MVFKMALFIVLEKKVLKMIFKKWLYLMYGTSNLTSTMVVNVVFKRFQTSELRVRLCYKCVLYKMDMIKMRCKHFCFYSKLEVFCIIVIA